MNHNPHILADALIQHIDSDGDDPLVRYLAPFHAALGTSEGRVVVRVTGTVDYDGREVSYCLIPHNGVLAKLAKWRKMGQDERLASISERITPESIAALNQQVKDFVTGFILRANEIGIAAGDFLQVLNSPDTATPVNEVFDRISQRLDHAAERLLESRHAERTRQSINLGEYPESFTLAARLPRKFVALLGPTNSGKTHEAMVALAEAPTGVYLAPLRLLALENFERLQAVVKNGQPLKVSLVTGEERRLTDGATHVASTVEMLDTTTLVDVAVIDEIQMLSDRDRGAAWTAAVCGAPARTVYLVGAVEARRAVEALASRLECPIEIRVLKRKGPLSIEPGPVRKLRNLRRGDAVIAFSRRDVLMWRDLITEAGFSVATIYGNLSPEVRRAQAARFREREADIVVGTDAIAMGLNLPIERVVMTTAMKYNGVEEEELPASLARQIAGRAGRFGVHEEGFVAGFDEETHWVMKSLMREKLPSIAPYNFSVAPTLEHLHRIKSVTNEGGLSKLLRRFAHNVDVPDGFFTPRITEEQSERAAWLDILPLALEDKFTLSLVPISSRVPSLHLAWQKWAKAVASRHAVLLHDDVTGIRYENLQELEDRCRMFSAYAWLGFRLPEMFPDGERATELAQKASDEIDAVLKAQNAGTQKRRSRRYS